MPFESQGILLVCLASVHLTVPPLCKVVMPLLGLPLNDTSVVVKQGWLLKRGEFGSGQRKAGRQGGSRPRRRGGRKTEIGQLGRVWSSGQDRIYAPCPSMVRRGTETWAIAPSSSRQCEGTAPTTPSPRRRCGVPPHPPPPLSSHFRWQPVKW